MITDPAGIFYYLFAIKEQIIYLFYFSGIHKSSEVNKTLIVKDAMSDCYGRISYIKGKGTDVSESWPGPGP